MPVLLPVPARVRTLIVTCFSPHDRQFRGIAEALQGWQSGSAGVHRWQGEPLRLARRRNLRQVLLTGHGSENKAGFHDAGCGDLQPAALELPPGCDLYLMGCYQGRAEIKRQWAQGTGSLECRIHGCAGETESFLSTCLAVNLMESGDGRLDFWFSRWIEANDAFRPFFKLGRRIYAQCGQDPLKTLEALEGRLDLDPFRDLLEAAVRHPGYLTGLLP